MWFLLGVGKAIRIMLVSPRNGKSHDEKLLELSKMLHTRANKLKALSMVRLMMWWCCDEFVFSHRNGQLLYDLSVNPKGNQSWIFTGRTDARAEAPVLLPPDAKTRLIGKRPWCWERLKQKEKGTTEGEMVRQHHQLSGRECEQTPRYTEGQRSLACCSPWGHKESDTT